MIRSIGSSLLAKAGTGSLSRKKDEARIVKPEVPGKGAVGTAGRDLVQETNITPVAPGSEKIIRSAPGVESASLPGVAGMSANQVPLVAGIGSPGGAGMGGGVPTGQPGGAAPSNQNTPASAPGQAGRQAVLGATTGTPTGAVATARAAKAAAVSAPVGSIPESSAMGYQAPRAQDVVGSFWPGIANFGSRVSAEGEGSKNIEKNFGQAFWGTVGNVGQKLGIVSPAANAKMQSYATNPAVTKSGVGSISQPGKSFQAIVNSPVAQNIASGLRSVTQAAKNTYSNLRSKLFGKR